MTNIRTIAKRFILTFTAFMLINVPTGVTFAAANTSSDDCTAPASDQAGVHYPTGSDASTFVYQCDGANKGNWTNQYFVYNTATSERTPRFDPDYQYNCTTDRWTMVWWYYTPAQTKFYSSRVTADTTPDLPTNCPVATPAAGGNGSTGTSAAGANGQGINNTGNGSNNSTNNNGSINGSTTNNTKFGLNNTLGSSANTGNASIIGNTTAGNASTGNAMSIANIANMLQSTSNAFGPDTAIFNANINGDVTGDFMFDPSAQLGNTGANSNNDANNNLSVNTNNENNTNAQINNDINVGARSGDATVADNTNGGSATSGNADAVVNLMNFINSKVTAGQSFVGNVNINGNLNGDILLPQNLIDQLIAASGPGSTNDANANISTKSNTTNNTTQNINNNINSSATTGSANNSGNTNGGSATTGNADTNVTLLNLTGSKVVGKNNILVFVNVMGKWVGMIVNAPAGSTSASLGGGITNSGPNSTNSTNTNVTGNDTTTNNSNFGINNNVDVNARSGDANVTGNTNAGNATTGNAHTGVNVLNMTDSDTTVSGWYGVLFINVFGNWCGSFGVNTRAGDAPTATNSNSTTTTTSGASTTAAPAFQFVPRGTVPGANNRDYNAGSTSTDSGNANGSTQSGTVLAAATKQAASLPTVDTISPAQKTANKLIIPAVGIIFALAILIAGERRNRAHSHRG